jgi:hypothetical protein
VAEDREQAIEQIVDSARQARPRTPRWLWVAAGLLGLACAMAFVIVVVSDPDPSGPSAPSPDPASGGRGFGTGLVLGVGAGIAIGFVAGRQRVRDHSSRKSP